MVSPIADLYFASGMDIPLEDNQYDVVFCNHVMEHVDDPIRCMSEPNRVMKPGGWAIMQVPQDMNRSETYEDKSITSPQEREKHYWQKDHVRLFGKDYPDYLTKSGFKVDEFDLNAEFNATEVSRYRLMKDEILYISKKIKL